MIAQSPWLGSFAKQRNNRRSHAGNRWKRMLLTLIQAMIEGWCDLDLLLDPFFLHFPKRTDERRTQRILGAIIIEIALQITPRVISLV
ncbi:Hypothetical protein PHPALM_2350 [Phytophthora palmivora]|uniref:Uncharacterized protein n=1 Tax=Phytophthora palmivora TaxID=4796 RepID=A0A2P4YPZ2_9STRA|nr:Hypothetical protein PHPALM_2350 [Phytophthora palmivora]